MTDKNIKLPEIAVIIAMTESGLIGNGDKLPWKSSLDFEWFKKNTMSWPMIFGRKTAAGMPVFPLRNRPCAVVTNSYDTEIKPAIDNHGAYLSFGQGPFFNSLGETLRFYKNFDKIFIAGGTTLYNYAMQLKQPWFELLGTPNGDKPLVDTIIKTVFPDGYVTGDKYLDNNTIKLMGEPYFKRVSYQEYRIDSSNTIFNNFTLRHEENQEIISMPARHKLGKKDTPFSTIRFEIWNRINENSGK